MNRDLSALNFNQLTAVEWDHGPVLVLAGPGSGKTRVLTHRVVRIISETSGKHFKILALTFTNKAAVEMRERIEALVPESGSRFLATTFHSYAAALLRQHGHHVGLKPNFTILTQDVDRQAIVDEAIRRTNPFTVNHSGERLLPLFTRLTERCVPVDSVEDLLVQNDFTDPGGLANAYRCYRKLMIESECLDFAGLIAEAFDLLRTRSGVRKQVQRVYPFVCVDEFQDTNRSQYEILRQIVDPESKNLFVVADDDQIIFQWRGASPKRLNELMEDFDVRLLQLPENFRCPEKVVELANRLIANNPRVFPSRMPQSACNVVQSSNSARLLRFRCVDDEMSWVAKDIANLNDGERSSCAVLARTRKLLSVAVRELERCGIRGYLPARKVEFDSIPMQWLHSVLRLANAPGSREHLRKVCRTFFEIEEVELSAEEIVSHASAEDGNFLRSWAIAALRQRLRSPTEVLIRSWVLDGLVDRMDFRGYILNSFRWVEEIRVAQSDGDDSMDEFRSERETWENLVGMIQRQYGKDGLTLRTLLHELDLSSKASEPKRGDVPCYTIHSSKGWEFDHVYLTGMVEDQLPSWSAIKKGDESPQMQEERRNCFVAITRCQKVLTLTYSDKVFGWKKERSRFLCEMGLSDSAHP